MPARLGQHFLRDPRILDRIAAALELSRKDVVVEIGPGEGTLTSRLLAGAGHVLAIERDAHLATRLPDRLSRPDDVARLRVITADALTVDWQGEAASLLPGALVKIAGNIPYYITSPLIEQALRPPPPAVVVFLVQREVADRISARPGTKAFGSISVGVQSVAEAERLFIVRAGAFQPPPNVDSAVIRLRPLAQPLVSPDEGSAFRAFTTAVFGQRRKQLGRSLRDVAKLSAENAAVACTASGVDPSARPETLTPMQFVRLFRESMR